MNKFLTALALVATLALSGCAEWQAAASGFNAAGITMAHNVADDALVVERETFCAQPYSSLVRNSSKDASVGATAVSACGQLTVPQVVTGQSPTLAAPAK